MKRLLLIIFPFILATVIFVGFLFYMNKDSGTGALQVTTTPPSKVYLNGKVIGRSPLCRCEAQDMLPVGDYTIRLEPEEGGFSPFEQKIKISTGVLTVVDRTFGKVLGASTVSEGSTITLTPLENKNELGLQILSFPDNAQVLLDSNPVGQTPLYLTNVTESDHEVTFKKDGYKDKTIRIRAVKGYKLEAVIFLGIKEEVINLSTQQQASESAVPAVVRVTILQTPTGFLRVRESASLNGAEVGRVTPGETFDFIEEQEGWYQIKLSETTSGWVSAEYAQKQ